MDPWGCLLISIFIVLMICLISFKVHLYFPIVIRNLVTIQLKFWASNTLRQPSGLVVSIVSFLWCISVWLTPLQPSWSWGVFWTYLDSCHSVHWWHLWCTPRLRRTTSDIWELYFKDWGKKRFTPSSRSVSFDLILLYFWDTRCPRRIFGWIQPRLRQWRVGQTHIDY